MRSMKTTIVLSRMWLCSLGSLMIRASRAPRGAIHRARRIRRARGAHRRPARTSPAIDVLSSAQERRRHSQRSPAKRARARISTSSLTGLDVSPELKTWMKKHQSVRLSGEEFTKSLTPERYRGHPRIFQSLHDAQRGISGRRLSRAEIQGKRHQVQSGKIQGRRRKNMKRPFANLSAPPRTLCRVWTSNSSI